jgi:hypothetical protein
MVGVLQIRNLAVSTERADPNMFVATYSAAKANGVFSTWKPVLGPVKLM